MKFALKNKLAEFEESHYFGFSESNPNFTFMGVQRACLISMDHSVKENKTLLSCQFEQQCEMF